MAHSGVARSRQEGTWDRQAPPRRGGSSRLRARSAVSVSARQLPPPLGRLRRGGAGRGLPGAGRSAARGAARPGRGGPVSAMASPSRRLQTKPVITCLKSVLLTYTFVFWVSSDPRDMSRPRLPVATGASHGGFSPLPRCRVSCCWPWACGAG